MPLTTQDFPQADRLEKVANVAVAVRNGQVSDHDIERFIGLASHDRQGRYYRKAAELIGLITTKNNRSSLTNLGEAYVALTTAKERRQFLAACLAQTPLFAELARFIKSTTPTQQELQARILELYPGKKGTALRRANSIISYIEDAGLGDLKAGKYLPGQLAGAALVQTKTLAEGLGGRKPRPMLIGEGAGGLRTYTVDNAKLERANLVHQKLVAGVAALLDGMGLTPLENAQIDLFAKKPDAAPIIYEMKSVAGDNFLPQMRKAVAQLYEYRYDSNEPSARLCVVTNKEPLHWEAEYVEYLETDRDIAYLWSDDFTQFSHSPPSGRLLNGYAP